MVIEQLEGVDLILILPVELQDPNQLLRDLPTSIHGAVLIYRPGSEEPVWAHNERHRGLTDIESVHLYEVKLVTVN